MAVISGTATIHTIQWGYGQNLTNSKRSMEMLSHSPCLPLVLYVWSATSLISAHHAELGKIGRREEAAWLSCENSNPKPSGCSQHATLRIKEFPTFL